MEELKLALKVDDLDNIATIFADAITDGTRVEVRDKKREYGGDHRTRRCAVWP